MDKNKRFSKPLKRISILTATMAIGLAYLPGISQAAIAPLAMGTASTYGVLASSAITSAAPSALTGTAGSDIGSGIAYTGTIAHLGTTLVPAPAAALTNANTAYNDARSSTPTVVELGAGRTILPGAYSGGTLAVNGTLTLDGQNDPTSVFIFRSSATLITGVSSQVLLTNGAQACNVFWQLGSSATLGDGSTMVGHVIALASISTGTTSVVTGQLIALTGSVTLGGTTIVNNNCAPPVVTPPTSTPTPVQTSQVLSYLPVVGPVAGGTVLKVNVAGTGCLVSNVSVDNVALASSQWSQTGSVLSVTMPAHAVGSVGIQIYNGCAPVLAPLLYIYQAPAATVVPAAEMATLHIIKVVKNTEGGVLAPPAFSMHVTQNGLDVVGSPQPGASDPGTTYILPVGDYILAETPTPGYGGDWINGPITGGGSITLRPGDNITVTRLNYDIVAQTPQVPPVPVDTTPPTPVDTTASGGTLPNTSTPWGNFILVGSVLVLLGSFGFASRKVLVK